MGKDKKEKRKSVCEEEDGADKEERWDELVSQVGPIANPLASRKLTKKLFKVVKKGTFTNIHSVIHVLANIQLPVGRCVHDVVRMVKRRV